MISCEGKCRNWIAECSFSDCSGGEPQSFPAYCVEKPNPSDWTTVDCKLINPIGGKDEV